MKEIEKLRQQNKVLKGQLEDFKDFKKKIVPLMRKIAIALEKNSKTS